MHKRDIESVELVKGGILLTAKDGRTALLKFRDSERLRSASAEQRAAFRLSFGGLRWDEIDEDLSYDSIFEPQAHSLRGGGKTARNTAVIDGCIYERFQKAVC